MYKPFIKITHLVIAPLFTLALISLASFASLACSP